MAQSNTPVEIRNFVAIYSMEDQQRINNYKRMLADYKLHFTKKNQHTCPMLLTKVWRTDSNRKQIEAALAKVVAKAIPISFNYD